MPSIHLLADDVINKIAAGEVVERPASVVKELVENSIDAGATEIRIDLEEGGTRRITVQDNGLGIAPDQLEMAVKRHATSKIELAEDLFEIASMGFRGEALASISAVSRFQIVSRQAGQEQGAKISFAGEQVEGRQSWVGPVGTQVTVSDLFFNIPARKKFLKSAASEFAHCLEFVQAMVLCHPEVGFHLTHNGKDNLKVIGIDLDSHSSHLGEENLRSRALAIFGEEVSRQLLYGGDQNPYGEVEVLFSPPGLEKPSGKNMFFFVNRRWVKDQTLRYGVLRAYHSHLSKGQFPQVLLHVRCDPSLVDVNVHPAKTEVKFQYGGEVQSIIALTIRKFLRQGAWALPQTLDLPPDAEVTRIKSMSFASDERSDPPQGQRSTPPLSFGESLIQGRRQEMSAETRYGGGGQGGVGSKDDFFGFGTKPTGGVDPSYSNDFSKEQVQEIRPIIDWSSARYLGSFAKCYLFFEIDGKLLALDQHAFHERIIFERLSLDQSLVQSSQRLFLPEIIELPVSDIALLGESQGYFRQIGFDFEVIDAQSIELKAVPLLLVKRDPEELLRAILRSVDFSSNQDAESLLQHALATIACHSAVRAGEDLSPDDLSELLRQAQKVDFYANCPHGRRVFRWFKKTEVERWFDR